ncbi:MAG: tRNA epoxyqueuosine(34) reductase QueG [Hyphomicrobiales bacterium]|nr:tRNA epoxyqueuosine(34) reductase QueG [Hyphomicrobiales bacterium]
MNNINADKLKRKIQKSARELGFDVCKITSAQLPHTAKDNLQTFVDKSYHGSMSWIEDTLVRRTNPRKLWQGANSVIMLAMNYGSEINPLEQMESKNSGAISIYARNRDYHDIVKGKLKILAGKLVSWSPCDVKVFVDTAPVMEKPLAYKSGLGWQGKHTNLVSREFGSWLFLGSIFTSANLPVDCEETDHCGNCQACLEICPTKAFPAPYKIDARRCISYLTIENKGPIPPEFRISMGNRIFGCDDCLAICPWNKFAKTASEIKLQSRGDLTNPDIEFLIQFDEQIFRKFFSASPVKRIGRDRFIRNVLIAAGNSGNKGLINLIICHIKDPDSIVRGAAVWAFRMLADDDQVAEQREIFLRHETDCGVRNEWSYHHRVN